MTMHRHRKTRCLIFTLGLVLLSGLARAGGTEDGPPPPGHAARLGDATAEADFLAENSQAMDRMMAAMAVAPSGDIDRDFVAMMTPHHQGAIDMARAMLRHGRNEQLRRLAQEIIVTQQQEIAAMRLAIGDPLPPSAAAPPLPSHPDAHGHAAASPRPAN